MPPGELLYALRDAGINLMPVDADAQYALFPSDEAPVPVECKMLDLEKS